uniref:Uncharacterized protein n=1 Tax=Elaeophora elaphi TaxID=1147741 RepID=A0A0R3RW10_9BILA
MFLISHRSTCLPGAFLDRHSNKIKTALQLNISGELWEKSGWCTPPFIVVYLLIGNAALIITIIAVAILLSKEVNYRSEKEFLLQLQRVYDTAIYSLFGIPIFYIITSIISMAIRLKVIKDSVDFIAQQVNQQGQEFEKTVRRFVTDAFFVKKYFENGPASFAPIEALSVQQAVSKYKEVQKELNVNETIGEISKQLTMLSKMVAKAEGMQFDTKFTKLIEELHKTGQTTIRKSASRITQVKVTKCVDHFDKQPLRTKDVRIKEFSKTSTTSQIGRKHKSRYGALKQRVKGQKSLVAEQKTQLSAMPSSNMARKISQFLEMEKTQSSSHSRNQRNLSTKSRSDGKMIKLPKKSFKTSQSKLKPAKAKSKLSNQSLFYGRNAH